MTRLASGDPRMSHDICASNADGVVHWLDRLIEELQRYRGLILGDRKALFKAFSEVQLQRDAFVLGERPRRSTDVDLPSTKDAIGGMIFGGLLQSKMDKFEKDMSQAPGKRKSPSVLDDDD
jgi:hypothetical protein